MSKAAEHFENMANTVNAFGHVYCYDGDASVIQHSKFFTATAALIRACEPVVETASIGGDDFLRIARAMQALQEAASHEAPQPE